MFGLVVMLMKHLIILPYISGANERRKRGMGSDLFFTLVSHYYNFANAVLVFLFDLNMFEFKKWNNIGYGALRITVSIENFVCVCTIYEVLQF